MAGNEITDEGAVIIAKLLLENRFIERIYLQRNRITDQGAETILDALKHRQHRSALSYLYLHDNTVSDELQRTIAEAISANKEVPFVSSEL